MTFFKNQIRKRKALTVAVCLGVLAIVCGILVFVYQKEKQREMQAKEPMILTQQENVETEIQKTVAVSLEDSGQENTRLKAEVEKPEDDWRIHGFPYIKLTGNLKVGDYVDVRISFADGGDFVVLSKKQIQGLSPLREEGSAALWLIVSEEEILRLASAAVDAYCNEGCSIYAIQYVSDTQKEATVNYVVSDTVKQLMEEDPNIVKKAENVQEYSKWKEYETGICRGDTYPEQDEIIYMD